MVNKVNQLTDVQRLQLQHTTVQNSVHNQFNSILQQELNEAQRVQFSKHAIHRIQERRIPMTDNVLQDLNSAILKAKKKGAKDVAVIGENGVFIVNVPHNIVVTIMSKAEMKENIFTNIDSAVLI